MPVCPHAHAWRFGRRVVVRRETLIDEPAGIPLIRAQCNHRIDTGCFPGGNIPGDRRNRDQKRSHLDKCHRVAARYPKQQAAERALLEADLGVLLGGLDRGLAGPERP